LSLSHQDFARLSNFIHEQVGIKMPPSKKIMLEGRLQKRMRILGMDGCSRYCDYFFDLNNFEDELVHLIDQVTTNKTDFFREPEHFAYLTSRVLPELGRSFKGRPARLWSAGCSTGEEPYTLSMVLSDYARRQGGDFGFRILATDISTQVLSYAKRAVYSEDRIEPVAMEQRRNYLLRSKDPAKGLIRIAPSQRKAVEFRRLNFMDRDFGIREAMDVIFCRNVLIYFTRETQFEVVSKLCSHLRPGGYLFLGHSESLHGLSLPLEQVGPTIYRRIS